MEHVKGVQGTCNESEEDMMDLRRGPWTVDEDFTLINYIALHGEGRWNSLARCAGLKRTGKSCRLRWLNYLRPDVRRGNITLEEQLLILELHCRWGNRWSKIAQHLPGRTDNEIKNYWRTRVQKHAKQLKCDVNSKQFKDTMRYLWMPRLMERIQAAAASGGAAGGVSSTSAATAINSCTTTYNLDMSNMDHIGLGQDMLLAQSNMASIKINASSYTPENSSTPASSDSFGAQVSPVVSDLTDGYNCPVNHQGNNQDYYRQPNQLSYGESLTSPTAYFIHGGLDFQPMDDQNNQWSNGAQVLCDNLWNVEDMWFLHHQLNGNV